MDAIVDRHREEMILNRIKQLKQVVLPDGKLLLFGSRARKDATADSDWDMLMLLDKPAISNADFDRYAYPFVELGWNFGEYFSVKLYTLSEWQDRKNTPFYKNVMTEGFEL